MSLNADKWGPIGTLVAALCCLGAVPILGAVSAVGLGVLIHNRLMTPLMSLFIAATLWGLRGERERHGSRKPEAAAWAGAVLAIVGLPLGHGLTVAGLALLVAGSAWSWLLVRRRRGEVDGGPAGERPAVRT